MLFRSSARWPNLPWLHTDSWIKNSKNLALEDIANQSESQPDDLCFLQFTSGSTGDAKGVMITHGGLIHNVKLMRRRYKSTSKTVLISWLPQYHDMGLRRTIYSSCQWWICNSIFTIDIHQEPTLMASNHEQISSYSQCWPEFCFRANDSKTGVWQR